MPNDLTPPDPERFGLASFADLLPPRDHIIGEAPGSFNGFRAGMMQSLSPITPYECVVAENVISIEWELLQHRRMRDVGLRQRILKTIKAAVLSREKYHYDSKYQKVWNAHVAAGGSEDDWEYPDEFDSNAAETKGNDLAKRAVSKDQSVQEQAYIEIAGLGLEPVEIMGEAYRSHDNSIIAHDQKLPDLERRRREVKRDFDLLQRARPVEAEVIEG